MGGATSVDKHLRKEGISWWPQEIPTLSDREYGVNNLTKNNWKVDYIITHCGPREVMEKLYYESDEINAYFSFILKHTTYKHWFIGHYHLDRGFPLTKEIEKISLMYNDIKEII